MTSHSPEPVDVNPGRLSPPELDEMLELRLIANLGTYEADGRIHLIPMWFMHREGEILIPTSSRTRKVRNLRGRPWAAVMIDHVGEYGMDMRGALVRGPVELTEGPEALELNLAIHLRYITEAGLAKPEARYLNEGDDLTIRVRMEEVVTWNLAAGAAARALRGPGLTHPLD